MCCQVLPASADLKIPTPAFELRKMLASPVPNQTMFGSDGATSTLPPCTDAAWSKLGSNVVPSFSVFHRPPEAVAT